MKDKANPKLENILRQKAEELIDKKSINTDKHYTDIEIFKLVHELDVHQIELEMQNEELNSAKSIAEANAEKYTNLYDFAPSGYFTLSKEGEIIELNFSGATLLGKERSLLVNNRFGLFIANESKPTFNLFLEEIFESKTRQTCEILLSTNSEIPIFVNLTGIVDEDEKQCVITMHDISQLKKAETEIKNSEEKYRSLFESNRDSITIVRIGEDSEISDFIEANPAAIDLFGYPKNELFSMSGKDLSSISPKKRKEIIDTILTNGKVDFETVIRNKKGKLRNVEIQSIIINYLNKPAVMNITRDITERKQIEQNIKKAQENLITILEAIPDMLFEVDLEGQIYFYQGKRNDLLVIPERDFIGKKFQEIISTEAANVSFEAMQEALNKGLSTGKQYSLDLAQGTFWFELSVSPIADSDIKNKHFILLARDITQRKVAEEQLKFEKERIKNILELVGSPIFLKDNDHKITYANSAFYNLFNLDENSVIGKTLAENVLENEKEHFLKIDRTVLDTGIPDSREEELTIKGFKHTIITRKTRYIDALGNKMLVGSIFDITKRKKAEEALHKTQEKLQGVFNLANSGIVIIDRTGGFLLFNDWCCKLLGYTKAEFQELNTTIISHPEDLKKSSILNKKIIEGKIDTYQIEKRYLKKDKSFVWCEISASAIKDKDNNVVNIIGVINDITERRKIQDALQESEKKLRSIFDTANSGIILTDLQGNFIHHNKWFEKTFGYTNAEIQNLTVYDISHPDDIEKSKKALADIVNGKREKFVIEKQYIKKDGTLFWAEISVSGVKNKANKVVGTMGIINDITERRRAEQKLITSENLLKQTQKIANLGSYSLDFTTGKWTSTAILDSIFGIDANYEKNLEGWNKILHPEWKKIMSDYLNNEVIGKKNNFNKEYKIIKVNTKEERWLQGNGEITFNKEGQPLYLIGSIQDITEHKKMELALIDSENFAKATFDALSSHIAILDENGFVLAVNKAWTDYMKTNSPNQSKINSAIGQSYLEICKTSYCNSNENAQAMLTGIRSVMKREQKEFIHEYSCHSPSELRWFSARVTNFPGDDDSRIVVAHEDITARKLATISQEKTLDLFEKITQRLPGVVFQYLLRPDGTSCFPYASDGLKQIYDVYPDEVKEDASKVFKIIHPDDLNAVIASIQKSAKSLTPWNYEYRAKNANGSIRFLHGNSIPQKLEDGSVLWHGFITDITERQETIESLRESEEKYRSLVENSPDGVVIYVEEKIAFINKEGLRMVGLKSKEEMIGKSVFQFIHPDSLSNIIKKMEEVVQDRHVSSTIEEKFLDINGVPFDVELKAIPTHYGHKAGVQVIIHDITRRKKDALELNKINRVYALISQINNLILRTHNRQELFQEICNIAVNFGKFHMSWVGLLDDNQKIITAAFAGHEEGYFTKSNVTTILDVPEGRGPTGIAMREGRTVICNDIANDPIMKPWRKDALERGYSSVISIPIIVRNTKIGVFNLYSRETNFFSSEEEISLLEKIILNIAFTLESILVEEDRKQTEEKIRQLSQAVEQSPVTIVISNINGDIEYVNSKFVETTGYQLEEVIGKNPRVLKSGYTSPKEYQELWNTLAAGKEWHGEFHNKKKDGTLFWESATISPILNAEGKTTHYIAIKEDITHRKKVEKELVKSKERAEESDRLKLVFLANMSHEIRTPMNGILGFTELLKEPKLTGEEQQEYISIIEKSGKRMLNIINDIISISKIESGQIEISETETNINEQIEYICTFFQPEAKQKGIQLTLLKKLSSQDNLIKTDREKVYAVLTNLVKNALKFTNEGSIEIGCEKKGGYLEFFVKDTGLGISKSQKKIIFERFRQANETISRSHEGSGLGLAISKAYVEMLDGKIWVESQEGKGSTFYFSIPYRAENRLEEMNVIEKSDSSIKEENKIKDLKVLIVEDDAISKLLITIAVKPYSKEILKVSTGFEAIEACRNNPDIDLVMMDINMPEMGGYEATKNIREFNKDLVIIAQTANGMQSDRDNAIAAGCTDYISKPINITDLGALIQKYFN